MAYDTNRVAWTRNFEEGWDKIMKVGDKVTITKQSSIHRGRTGIIKEVDFTKHATGEYIVEIAGLRLPFTGNEIEIKD